LNEAIALRRIEPLHSTFSHFSLQYWSGTVPAVLDHDKDRDQRACRARSLHEAVFHDSSPINRRQDKAPPRVSARRKRGEEFTASPGGLPRPLLN
jgi:hypothetical protein